MKISRRLVKIILDLFQTKPWFVRPGVNLVEFSRSISSSTFVKIFRIFSGVYFWSFGVGA